MLNHLQHEHANHEADQVFEYLVSHAGFDVAEKFLDALSDAAYADVRITEAPQRALRGEVLVREAAA